MFLTLDDQNSGHEYMMKDPILTSTNTDERPRIVAPNVNNIIGFKEHWKEAGVENVIKQLSNGHGKIIQNWSKVTTFHSEKFSNHK